jgi:four helix bundle protein
MRKDEGEKMKDENQKQPEDLRIRTRRYAVRIIWLFSALPSTEVARTLGKQLLRSGTSVGAHYREGVRSRSDAELISKWGGALQELEETAYWLELLSDVEVIAADRLTDLIRETDELIAIITTCVKTVKARKYV